MPFFKRFAMSAFVAVVVGTSLCQLCPSKTQGGSYENIVEVLKSLQEIRAESEQDSRKRVELVLADTLTTPELMILAVTCYNFRSLGLRYAKDELRFSDGNSFRTYEDAFWVIVVRLSNHTDALSKRALAGIREYVKLDGGYALIFNHAQGKQWGLSAGQVDTLTANGMTRLENGDDPRGTETTPR